MRTRALTTAAILAAVVVLWVAAWPPATLRTAGQPDPDLQRRTIAGAVHVHSTQSDGSGTRSEIADAAARAGLGFVVFTDHGDGTRPPEVPSYVNGVLCIDAVEISTDGGHYLALGLPQAPYRLGGEPLAVVEDVRRLGGFGIVAHPDSPKPALAWREWKAQPDGIEWLNADTEWRNDSWASLARSLLGYPARPAQALASILDRPSAALDRWDAATARRRVAAFAGHDAHGGPGRSQEEARRFGLTSIPSYEASFRSFAMRAVLRTPPTGSAREDGALLLDALRAGRSYTAIDSIAAPAWLEFHAERGGHRAEMGELLGGQGAARIVIRVPTLPGSVVVLLRNGVVLSESQGGEVTSPVAGPGAYRVEVAPSKRDRRAPWILSNPIYVDLPAPEPPPASPQVTEVVPLTTAGWTTEHDPGSVATVVEEGGRKGMSFELRPVSTSPFAALAAPLASPPPDFDSILVDITSSAPARLSIQFRSADGSARWKRSIYVGPDARPVVLRAADFLSAERGGRAFDPRAAASVLVVADLVNSIPGTSGRFFVRRLALTRQSF